MFSAIEALAKQGSGKKDWKKIEQILGPTLVNELFAPKTGLRHRLTHGEYLGSGDSGKDYVQLVHKNVVSYFNEHILKAELISREVVGPQRHFWGNKEGGSWFIKAKAGARLELKDVLADFEKGGLDELEHYTFDHEMKAENY